MGGVGLINSIIVPFYNPISTYTYKLQIKEDKTPNLFNQIKQVFIQQIPIFHIIAFSQLDCFVAQGEKSYYFSLDNFNAIECDYNTAAYINRRETSISFIVYYNFNTGDATPNDGATCTINYYESSDTIIISSEHGA